MRLGILPPSGRAFPTWPPLLATRGPGTRSSLHAHHALHVVLALHGELAFRSSARGPVLRARGVITAPDVPHTLDASECEILLVFIDPESEHGACLCSGVRGVQPLDAATCQALRAGGDEPLDIMTGGGAAWTANAVRAIAGEREPQAARVMHPRVRKLLRLLHELPPDADSSLEALAERVGLSPGRLMHAFTASIGTPLRPYLKWLRLQRAAAAIVGGLSLAEAAHSAGFSDAAHMSRTFRRMLGMPPSMLRPR
jgi:AraC-like DNA-binding protein